MQHKHKQIIHSLFTSFVASELNQFQQCSSLTCGLCPITISIAMVKHCSALCTVYHSTLRALGWGIVDYYPGHPVTLGEHSFRGLI